MWDVVALNATLEWNPYYIKWYEQKHKKPQMAKLTAPEHCSAFVATGASDRNWKGYGHEVDLPAGFADWKRKLISDPQTSGGLLVACARDAVPAVLKAFEGEGREIGRLVAGAPRLAIT